MKRIKMTRRIYFLTVLMSIFLTSQIYGIVKYDEGKREVLGIQLLQDFNEPNAYYYLPAAPRLASKKDGTLELFCIKYYDETSTSGGIFHALVEFSLPDDFIEKLNQKLKEETGNSSAYITGMVPMSPKSDVKEGRKSSFEIISSTYNLDGQKPEKSLITSGYAPLQKGAKAAFALSLNQKQTALLWESFGGAISDISVGVNGYYEAVTKAYGAVVNVDVSTLYTHLSKEFNNSEEYNRINIRNAVDELVQQKNMNIDIFDRSKSLGVSISNEEGIVDLITDKLIELMFDSKTGWSVVPEYEKDNSTYIPNRQKRGLFRRFFGGAKNQKYISDNQFIFKNRKDIRINKFYLNLNKSTTVKIPIHTAGNIGGEFFESLKDDDRYFREIDLSESFQWNKIYFNLDPDVVQSMGDILNSVAVNFRKSYDGREFIKTETLVFNNQNFSKDSTLKSIQFPRLGNLKDDWETYEYKVVWGFRQGQNVETDWIKSRNKQIDLRFSLIKKEVIVFPDFREDKKVRALNIRFFVTLNEIPYQQHSITIDSNLAELQQKVNIFCDKDTPVAYQVTWIGESFENGNLITKPVLLETDILYLVPPTDKEN